VITDALRYERYCGTPVRRVYIDKKGSLESVARQSAHVVGQTAAGSDPFPQRITSRSSSEQLPTGFRPGARAATLHWREVIRNRGEGQHGSSTGGRHLQCSIAGSRNAAFHPSPPETTASCG